MKDIKEIKEPDNIHPIRKYFLGVTYPRRIEINEIMKNTESTLS